MSICEIAKFTESKIRHPIFGTNRNRGIANHRWFRPIIVKLTKRTVQYFIAWNDGYREGRQMYRSAGVKWPFINL